MNRGGLGVSILVSLLTVPALAAIRPSFFLDHSAWKATYIVLATEGPTIDGKLEVIESWKGDLAPGSPLTVPALAAFADEGKRQVQWRGVRDLPEPYVRSVTGARMVVFLIRTNTPPQAFPSGSAPDLWPSASPHDSRDFSTSVVWIERGEAYAYKQILNPGPSQLVHDGSAIEMKARIACLTTIQSELEIAVRENDPIRAAQVFHACLHNNVFEAARESIDSLGRMGDRSLAVLRPRLHDITVYPWHPNVISAMVQAGGRAVSSDLIGVITEELSFWSEQAPNLKDGWWNAEPAEPRELRRLHYGRLLQALRSFVPPVEASDRRLILETRDLWQATAALAGIDNGQIAGACNALLKGPSERHE